MIFDGKQYLMRDKRSKTQILAMYAAFCDKYGYMPIHDWLITRGKAYKQIKEK